MSACTGTKANRYYRTEQLLELYFFLANLDRWEQIMGCHSRIFSAMGAGPGIPQGMRGTDPVMSVCFGSAASKVPRCLVRAPLLQTTRCIYQQHLLLINKEKPSSQLTAIFGLKACFESKGSFQLSQKPLTFFMQKTTCCIFPPGIRSHTDSLNYLKCD